MKFDFIISKPFKRANFTYPILSDNFGEELLVFADMLKDYSRGILGNVFISDIPPKPKKLHKLDYNKKYSCDTLIMITGNLEADNINEDAILYNIKAKRRILFVTDHYMLKKYYKPDKYTTVFINSIPLFKNAKSLNTTFLRYKFYKQYKETGNHFLTNKKGVFLGGDKNRENKFKEYVIRPDIDFYGYSRLLGVENKIDLHETVSRLSSYTYSPIFHSKYFCDIKLTTVRLLECAIFGLVPIIDKDYKHFDDSQKIYNEFIVKDYMDAYNRIIKNVTNIKNHIDIYHKLYMEYEENVFKYNFDKYIINV